MVEPASRDFMGDSHSAAIDSIKGFFQAASGGKLDEIRRCLQAGMDVNVRDKDQQTVLHYAVRVENREMVILLLNQPNILIDPVDRFGSTPLLCGSDFFIAKLLLDKGANVHASNNVRMNFLHIAVHQNDMGSILLALDRGANIETTCHFKKTVLLEAAENGFFQAVMLLLNRGANTEAISQSNETFIHLACQKGYISVIKVMFLSNQRRKIIKYLQEHDFWNQDSTSSAIRAEIQNAIRNLDPVMNLQQIVASNICSLDIAYKDDKNLPEDVKRKLDNFDFQLLRR